MNIGPIATLPSPSLSTAELRQYNESNCRITILVDWGSQIIRWTWGGETFVISAQSSLWFTSPRPEQLLPQIIRHTAQMQTGWRKYLKPRVLLAVPSYGVDQDSLRLALRTLAKQYCMVESVRAASYGNGDISGPIPPFCLLEVEPDCSTFAIPCIDGIIFSDSILHHGRALSDELELSLLSLIVQRGLVKIKTITNDKPIILLSGKLVSTPGLADELSRRTGVPCRIAETPQLSVLRGLSKLFSKGDIFWL